MRGNLIQTITGSGVGAIHKGLLGCRSWGNAFADAIKCKFQLILFGDANACARYPPFSRVNWACWMVDVVLSARMPRYHDARMPDCPVMSAGRQFPCLPRAAFLARLSTNQSKDVFEPPIPLCLQMGEWVGWTDSEARFQPPSTNIWFEFSFSLFYFLSTVSYTAIKQPKEMEYKYETISISFYRKGNAFDFI